VPVATAATSVGDSSFTANWNAYSGANYYLLDVSLNSSFSSFVGVYQNYLVYTTSQVVSGLSSNTTYYYRVRAVTGIDTDAAAFINRVYTAGGALSYTEATATEQLVADLKSYSIWSKMKAIYPMVGASSAACAQNLKSSSFTGSFSGGWTYASTGVTPNGTTGFMNTGFVSNSNLTINNSSFSVYVRTSTMGATAQVDFGAGNAGAALPLNNLETNSGERRIFCYDYSSAYRYITTTDASGMWGQSRSGSNSWISFRRNTSSSETTTTSQSSLPNVANYIGAMNFGGTANSFSSREIAFAHCSESLSSTEFNNFYTAVQAFQTTLSRAITP
jgi:hypothetical protein